MKIHTLKKKSLIEPITKNVFYNKDLMKVFFSGLIVLAGSFCFSSDRPSELSHVLTIDCEALASQLAKDVDKIFVQNILAGLPVAPLKDVKIEADLNRSHLVGLGLVIGTLTMPEWNKFKGFFLCWNGNYPYEIGEMTKPPFFKKLAHGVYGPQYPGGSKFHRFALQLKGKKLTAWMDTKEVYSEEMFQRPEMLHVGINFFQQVGCSPALIDNIKVFDVSNGEHLVYSNDFESPTNDLDSWKYDVRFSKFLKAAELPMGLGAGLQTAAVKFSQKGKEWYGFGIPGFGIQWDGERSVISAPGEGEIQITDVSVPSTPVVLGHTGTGFIPAFSRWKSGKFLCAPKGDGDFILDITDDKNIKRPLIEWQWPEKNSPRLNPTDFRYVMVDKGGKWLAALNPYSKRIIYFWDPKNIEKPTYISHVDFECTGQIFGGALQKGRIILAMGNLDESKDNGIITVDVSDIRKPFVSGWVTRGKTKVISAIDDTHILISRKRENKRGRNYYNLELWKIGDKIKDCKMLSSYQPEEFPIICADAWDDNKRELYLSLSYEEGTQDAVYTWNNGNKSTGTSAIDTIKVDKQWGMTLSSRLPSWGCSRFKSIELSPDKSKLAVSDYNYGVWLLQRNNEGTWKKSSGFMTPAEGHWAVWDKKKPYAYAFPTFGSQMRIIDCKNLNKPVEVKQFWLENWPDQAPAAIGNYLVVPQIKKMALIDVTDPLNPVKKDDWEYDYGPLPNTLFYSPGSCRAYSSDFGLLCVWTGTIQRGEFGAYLEIKQEENGIFKTVLKKEIRTPVRGAVFSPLIAVEGKRIYINDAFTNEVSVWEYTYGDLKKIGSISTEKWKLSRDFNMSYPGAFGVKNGIVCMAASGPRPANKPLIYVVDTSVLPFKHISTCTPALGSYIVDAKFIEGYLTLLNYGGELYLFSIDKKDGVAEAKFISQAGVGGMAWTIGDIKNKILAIPELSNLRLMTIDRTNGLK